MHTAQQLVSIAEYANDHSMMKALKKLRLEEHGSAPWEPIGWREFSAPEVVEV
jgi:hypothetical protein